MSESERKNKFLNILKHLITTEHTIESEWYSNVGEYIDDLDTLLSIIEDMEDPKHL